MNRNDIPYGRQFAISRKALARIWNCDERAVRRFVALLRRVPGDDETVILSSSSTFPAGYWRSSDPQEISAFIAEMTNRARNTFGALRDARRVLKNIQGKGGGA